MLVMVMRGRQLIRVLEIGKPSVPNASNGIFLVDVQPLVENVIIVGSTIILEDVAHNLRADPNLSIMSSVKT